MLPWLDWCDSGNWRYLLQAFTDWVHWDFGNVYTSIWIGVIQGHCWQLDTGQQSKRLSLNKFDGVWYYFGRHKNEDCASASSRTSFLQCCIFGSVGALVVYTHFERVRCYLQLWWYFFNSTKVCSIRAYCLWALPHLEMGAVLLKIFDDIVVVPRVDHLMMIYRMSQNKVYDCLIHL